QPGFSTKSQANAISGRGVGLDVVAREVENLRGALELTSQPGRGTQLTVRLPARLALEPALIVRVGGQALAIPALQVEHAQPCEPPAASPSPHPQEGASESGSGCIGDASVNYGGRAVSVVFARDMLGIGNTSPVAWPKLALVWAGSGLYG